VRDVIDRLSRVAPRLADPATARSAIVSIPGVAAAIDHDRRAGLLSQWGRSTVVDENTGAPVLPRAAVVALHELAGETSDGEIGNAGLLHVYGYLFSAEPTPYGAKRERWTGGGVARALGIAPSRLLPWTAADTTPLATLTALLPALLTQPPDGSLLIDERGEGVAVRTVLFTGRAGSAVAYAVGASAETRRLVTIFPVDDPVGIQRRLLDDPPRIRYNAVPPSGQLGQALIARTVTRHAVGGET
jgi:hypothetical protein